VSSRGEAGGTPVPYYAFLLCGVMFIIGAFLLGSSSLVANSVVIAVGGCVIVEGVILIADWRGGAREFTTRLRKGATTYNFVSPIMVRLILGGTYAALGAILIWGGVRYL
jgi:hypothetical protein